MGKKILIVDDAEVNRAILRQIFEDEYEILMAEDGETALSVINANRNELSLVLLDLKMPIMDGFTVLSTVKKNPLLHMIPIVVATEYKDKDNEMRALRLGAADFITKPYNVAIIRQRVRNIIDMQETLFYKKSVERDPLTGIYSRERFYSMVRETLHKDTNIKYKICCLNIDKFKVVNDLFGTCEGDKLLIFMAQKLSEYSGENYVYGRLGSDNFAVCMPDSGEEGAEEHLTEHMNEMLEQYPLHIRIVVRCGFYRIHDIEVPVEIMCDRANMAIAEIKGSYSTRFAVYDDKIRHKMLQEQEILNEMKRALDENQFAVYYQPKYNMENHKIIGAEALVRWIHPQKGIISPGVFIPVFEKNGFISALDMYVWEKTCQDLRNWMHKGYAVSPVSVNVSRAELYNTNLCVILKNMVAKYSIPIELLQLEITESAYTENPSQLIDSVNKLKAAGFVILMDDFGSGYSSLNTLKDVPVDVLKLDLKFLYNMDGNIKANYILKSVVQMAKRLELMVIAEGVETKHQEEFLKSIGCFRGQGYLYAKPMPAGAFAELIENPENVAKHDEERIEGLVNIDDLMSRIHSEDELEWYRAAMIQMNVMLVQYEVESDTLTLFDLRANEGDKELSKMEIPNFQKIVKQGKYVYREDITRVIQMLQGRQNQTISVRVIHHDRRKGYIWCRVSGRWIYDDKNQPMLLNCAVKDLTGQALNDAMYKLLNIFEEESNVNAVMEKGLPVIARACILGRIALMFRNGKTGSQMYGYRYTLEDGVQKVDTAIPFSDEETMYMLSVMNADGIVFFRRDSQELTKHMREVLFYNGAETVIISTMKIDENQEGFLVYTNTQMIRDYSTKELSAYVEISKCMVENLKRFIAESKRRESLELYKLAFEKSSMRLWEYDIESKVLFCSKSVQEEIGYEEYVQNVPESLIESRMIHGDFVTTYRNMYHDIKNGKDTSALYKSRHPDGSYKWMRINYSIIRDASGKPVKAIGFGEDVNAIYDSQKRICKNIKYRDQLSAESLAVFEVDLTDDKYLAISGDDRDAFRNPVFSESMRQFAMKYVLPEFIEEFNEKFSLRALLNAYEQGKQSVNMIYQQKNADGSTWWVEAVSILNFNEESHHINCFTYVKDVNELIEWAEEAKADFCADELTQVLKKQSFEQIVRQRLQYSKGEEVLFVINMDDFAQLNEAYGTAYGDEVLANAAAIIKATLPAHSLVGRIGGDCFACYIDQYETRCLMERTAENIVRHLFSTCIIDKVISHTTASVGIAFTKDHGSDYDGLLEKAVEFNSYIKERKEE